MKPTIGRIVHFVARQNDTPGDHYPAIVTHVWSDTCVNLEVFRSSRDEGDCGIKTSVVFDGDGMNGMSWHWPELNLG